MPITAQPPPPEPGRASFDSGFPPSYHKRGSQSSLQRSPSINTPQRQLSIDSQPSSDSGHPPSPFSSNSNPPPIDFDSHPNRIKSRRSAPRTISAHYLYENASEMDCSRRSSSSYRDSINSESFTDEQQFPLEPEVSPNESFPDERSFVEHDGGSHHPHFNTRHYSVPCVPSRPLHRSNTTATCHPSQRSGDYERMIHPRHSHSEIKYEGGEDPRDQYIKMQPAFINGPESALAQLRVSSDVHTPSPPLYQQTNQSLEPINEDRSDYENFPLKRDIGSESFTHYTPSCPSYENITQVRQELASRHSPSNGSGRSHREPVVLGSRLKSVSPPQSHNVRVAYIGNRDSPSPEIIATP